jgi:hypothetical protein
LNTREGTSVPDEEDDDSSDEDGRLAHMVGYHSPQIWFPKSIPKSLPQLWTKKLIQSLLVTK